ncbi:lipopolysaccharide biosynthesis protein [Streptococcus ruminantium]|uniref:lipopolysaccharide biosynthesis protein n=1 Tax=Streptococcus ruminantium TaxID=1917441 RepID=UPI001F008EAB|nr:oligosaccharide flippase family protein [Streptococcus ruminantium]BDD43002.1 polysaccharide biosynthesis protein [Streptococcus ruminantium]
MNNKFLKSSFLYTIGNLLIQGLAFFTLPIYTRVISKEAFGQFNLYMAWVGLLSLVIGLQTGGTLSSARVKYSANEYYSYVLTALSVSNIFFLTVIIVYLFFKSSLSSLFGISESVTVFLILQSYANYISGFFGQYFIQQQRALLNVGISAVVAILNVFLSLYFVSVFDNAFIARVLGQLLPSIFLAITALAYFYTRKGKRFNIKYIRFILAVSLPLIFHQLGHLLLNQLDRIMLGKMLNAGEVALYGFGYNIGLVMQIVLNSMNTAWVPWFFEKRKSEDSKLNRIIDNYLMFGLFLTLGYLTIFPELALLLGGVTYKGSHSFIGMIIASYFFVFLYTFPVNIQFFYANTRLIPIGTLLAAGVNFFLNYFMIPQYGSYGSAVATVISYFTLLIFHHVLTRKKYHYKDVTLRKYIILSTLVVFYSVLVTYWLESLVIRGSLGLVILTIYYFYYRDTIKNFLRKAKINDKVKLFLGSCSNKKKQ